MELNNDRIEIALDILHYPHKLRDAAVQEWLTDEQNKKMYEEFRIYMEAGLVISDISVPDPDIQLRLLQNKFARRRRLRILKISSYAAAVLFAFMFSWLGFKSFYSPVIVVENHRTADTIVPGRNQAVLITEAGERIVLGDERLENVLVGNGVEIDYDSVGGVKYKQSATAEVAYHTLKTPKGGEYKLVLNDGTAVWLNSESELKYPTKFNGKTRKVILTGEAYFAVVHDNTKPFVVESSGIKTKVYGTEFNVKSYQGQEIDVTLVMGVVTVTPAGEKQEYVLNPGENAHFSGDIPVIEKVNVQKFIAWKEGYFYYENERLETIVDDLKRWYDFDVVYSSGDVKNLRFELWSDRHSGFLPVTELLMKTNKIKVSVDGKTMVISETRR